jgi:flagellar hook-length control protein FliK
MAEILIALHAVPSSTQIAGRGIEPRTSEAARADTEAGAPAPFAAVLKSRSEKIATGSARETSSTAELPPESATADTVAAADPAALLSLLGADLPVAANAEQTTLLPANSPASLDQANMLTLLPQESAPNVALTAPASAADSFVASSRSAATPANPASAVTPAPTFETGEKPGREKNTSGQHLEPAAGLALERSTAPDKLAVEAAITATSAKTATPSTSHDPNEGEFRAIIERVANNPAAIGLQTNATSAPTAPTPGLRMETPLGQTGWRDEVGQKLTWMVSNNRQQAELVLNPPQLGRIEVTLILEGDRASVSFATPHPAVRETLENSMMRLREVLADAGVTLGQTHVGADSRHNSSSMHPKNDGLASTSVDGERHAATISVPGRESAWRSAAGRGMVDVFA